MVWQPELLKFFESGVFFVLFFYASADEVAGGVMFSCCPSGCPPLRSFFYHDNLRMAEGIQVKLGTSIFNDVKVK